MECNRDTSASTGQLSSASSTGGGMHHSLSTPAGVDGGARTPPATPKKGGKMLAIRVQMLDDTITIFQVQAKAVGRVLFDQVCKQLHLLEADYFGLEYQDDAGTKYWLDLQKPVSRQLGLSLIDPLLRFCVKFYTPDPAQLEEEYTRYLFCLQVKRDLSHGLLQCNDNTAAIMASYIVQAECGDYVAEDYPDHTYLSSYKFVPHQDEEMERRIMENHKKHASQSPAEADLNLLETARRCELYGMKMHPAKDHENVPLNLAVAHMGIVVFQNYTKINTFSWAKIRKISFKRKRFLIKLHPEGYGYYKDIVEFFFEGRNECKNFWKKCVENHGFFRCTAVKTVSRHKTRVLSRGSSFRYSGRTQKQIVEFVRDNYVKRQAFQRSASFRHSSAHSSATNMHTSTVGNSISAHPLLPLADSTLSVEATKLSASLGSMDVTVGTPAFPTTKSASRHQGTAISWSSVPDTRPTNLFAQTTTSPSPPLTTQSASPVTSATMSPQHMQVENQTQGHNNINNIISSTPVAVHAAVHRDDTGTIRTHTITAQMPSNRKLKGKLDQPTPVLTNNYPSQTQSQNDLDFQTSPQYTYKSIATPSKRKIWQRSSSCRELYDYSFEESGQAKRRVAGIKSAIDKTYIMEERKLESPVTRYDEHSVLYSGARKNSLEIHQDIMVCDHKVYSSSFPGTTSYSQESMEDPGNYDLRDSQDDLSHDSYELLEKSDDDFSMSGEYNNKYQKSNIKTSNARSCSLDSGNYLPSDVESDVEYKHKCKSSSDLQDDEFIVEDPRDYPRENNPRKSDGSFYKALKLGSRASSLESRSDYYDTKTTKSDRRPSREGSFASRTSSQESRSDSENKKTKTKSSDSIGKCSESRTSSFDSKEDYFDAVPKLDDLKYQHDYDRKIPFERNYGIQKINFNNVIEELEHTVPVNTHIFKETSHVHSISLQNVVTESKLFKNGHDNFDYNTFPKAQSAALPSKKSSENGRIKSLKETKSKSQKSTESESNIFSFDEERIQFIQESDASVQSNHAALSIVSTIENHTEAVEPKKDKFRDTFMEIEPKHLEKSRDGFPLHQPIERTKSDPNSLSRQRLSSNARRHLLMHQKSIDLTPCESSDDDYLYRQIPSAPPIPKHRGMHFEMPTAEFGHFDILKREIEGQKTKFEVPKSQFEILGAKTQSDLTNLPPKEDIPYTLHKRHIMNGTASKEESLKYKESSKLCNDHAQIANETKSKQLKPKSPVKTEPEPSFLFTQNIDLSKVDPVTLEIDKTKAPIQHMSSPKRDITRIDPVLLETLNSKLSQIESDSPTSSKTESLKPDKLKSQKLINDLKAETTKYLEAKQKSEAQARTIIERIEGKPPIKDKIKTDIIKPKRIAKPRGHQLNKKGMKSNKTKVRITSFSSDDESLDSDDVFGSAEATPTKLEFSPPQTRKEMESILKYEAERKYLQYTMSSTEVEGSPPQTRKTDNLLLDRCLDPNYQTELRRISERSISIPSSEDDFNVATADLQPVFLELPDTTLATVPEVDKETLDKSADSTLCEHLSDSTDVADDVKVLEEAVLLQELPEEPEILDEKALLQYDIERDLKDLQVPAKTKITEICSPTSQRRGHSHFLFSHARLNLSEGSAFSMLQKQQATEEVPGRRAKSLDTPVVSVRQLPALNALSSKDDTVEEEDELLANVKEPQIQKEAPQKAETAIKPKVEKGKVVKGTEIKAKPTETKSKVGDKPKVADSKPKVGPKGRLKGTDKEKDQIVPDVSSKQKKAAKMTVSTKAQKSDGKTKVTSTKRATTTKEVKPDIKDKPPPKPPHKTPPKVPVRTVSQKAPPAIPPNKPKLEKTSAVETTLPTQKSLPTELTLSIPEVKEIKRAKSQEIESSKKTIPKEKAKSLEKLEFKRERLKSQEDSDTDIAKRQEKQQMLYEIAISQTKTIKSPIKDALPVFPQVEESVRERHGKLEISINTIENTNVSLEEAIIITKSPKRLDKKMDKKLTKSLELNVTDREEDGDNVKTMQRLGKSLDLENRPKETEIQEFDFDIQLTSTANEEDVEASPEIDNPTIQELVEAEVHKEPLVDELQTKEDETVVLEGTSLDIWLSLEDKDKAKPTPQGKLENIVVIQKSNDFFEQRSRPPDLNKTDTKSSSDSQSLEKTSLGNSMDIKYIDDSGDSSHKSSEKDAQELKKASNTLGKFITKKLENRRKMEEIKKNELVAPEVDNALVRITSEDESLTEISELKCELDANLLAVANNHKDALLKLSIERSRSEDTGSWMTVECDEYIGVEDSFDFDGAAPLESPEKTNGGEIEETKTVTEEPTKEPEKTEVEPKETVDETTVVFNFQQTENVELKPPQEESKNLLTTETKNSKLGLLKRNSDQSRSSDTTGSWTSGEKDLSPGNWKETGDESSVSCTMGQTIGLSQTIETYISTLDPVGKISPEEIPRSPRSPRSPRICVLGRAFTIDEESNMQRDRSEDSSSEEANNIPKDVPAAQETSVKSEESKELVGVKFKKSRYPFEEKWSSDSELGQRIHQRIAKKLSSAERSMSSMDDSFSEKRSWNGKNGRGTDKRSLLGVERLSAESRSSLDTESSSGSLGLAVRKQKTGEMPSGEASSTWRPFPLESSGSSSLEEGILPQDQDQEKEYFVSGGKVDLDVPLSKENVSPDDLSNFPTNFGYPCLTSNVGLGLGTTEILGAYGTAFLGRTLSRISERSTNSEKSSLDEDSTKASIQLDSLNGDSLTASDRQGSISSDSPSHAHVSDSEKKTPTNELFESKKSLSRQFERPTSEHISQYNSYLLQRQISDDRRTSAEMAELSIDDIEIITSESGLRLKRQDSDDTIIDEELLEPELKNAKEFRGSSSQESDEWPLPDIPHQPDYKSLLALHETGSSDASQITTQVYKPPQPSIPKVFGLRGSIKSQDSEPWPSPPSSIQESAVTGSVETHYITPPEEACKVLVDSNTNTVSTYDDSISENEKTLDIDAERSNTASDPTYENVAPDQTDPISEAISDSLSAGPSGVKIILDDKSQSSSNSNSEEDLNLSNLNDDVFVENAEVSRNELRPPTALRRSTNSDDSSNSGHKTELRVSPRKGSHSSYSEEECTSSMGTNLEDGTVRLAVKPTRCTHSSHSEDTSIALSLSEWSNSTNTVKFQNLSTSNSGATKSSSGLKSDDNSLADIAQSISEWSSSNSKVQSSSLQFQKLSSSASTGDSSTLTEFIPTISERSSSDTSKTLIPQKFYPARQSVSRLGSSIDDLEVPYEQKNIKSPQNIPSEDFVMVSTSLPSKIFQDELKSYTKSTERPVVIPVQFFSDTDKSTEGSSIEQRTEKPKFVQRHQSFTRSNDRPIKVPLSKCSPYYSSSLSSESTPVPSSKSFSVSKTATVPLTRSHRKPVSKNVFQAKSPPSENDSTSSMESPKSTPESRDRRGYRRRRQVPQKRHKVDRHFKEEYFYVEQEPTVSDYNNYIQARHFEDLSSSFPYESVLTQENVILQSVYSETLEEGYFPDGDSQSGSDIFRMERDDDSVNDRYELVEGFDVSSIPPPLLEDDYEDDRALDI